jgi:hypothetical protein
MSYPYFGTSSTPLLLNGNAVAITGIEVSGTPTNNQVPKFNQIANEIQWGNDIIGVNALQLQGVNISGIAPQNDQVLKYNSGLLWWEPATDSGVISLTPIGAVPNANGATVSGGTLNLQPANASFGGVITTGTQSFAGSKTFTGSVAALSMTQNGNNVLDTTSANSAIFNANKIQSVSVAATVPLLNQVLTFDGGSWQPQATQTPTGSANTIAIFNGSGNLSSDSTNSAYLGTSASLASGTASLGASALSVALGGSGHVLTASNRSAVLAGQSNTITSPNSNNVIIGGVSNSLTSTSAANVIICGSSSSGTAGSNNLITGDTNSCGVGSAFCIVGGRNTSTTGQYSFLFSDNQAVANANTQTNCAKWRLANGMNLTNNTTNANNNAAALLQIDTTNKGFLKPRLTTAQKTAIASPPAGLECYDSTLNEEHYYNGTSWVPSYQPSLAFYNEFRGPEMFINQFATATASINNNFQIEYSFPNAGTPYICFTAQTPPLYVGGNINVILSWYAGNTGDCVWQLDAQGQPIGAAIDNTPVSQLATTGTSAVANNIVSTTTSASGVSLAVPAGTLVSFKLFRDAGNISDTLTVAAKLIGVYIQWA